MNKHKFKMNKHKLCSIVLILLLAVSAMMTAVTMASAQISIPQPRTTYTYISVAPTLVGVGQTLTVNLWVNPLPQNYSGAPNNDGFRGLTVTFTRPDGTKDTFTPPNGVGTYADGQTDPLGSLYFWYTPNMEGNWSVTASFPGQSFTDFRGTAEYAASTSKPAYFTVQKDPVLAGLLNGYPWAPLPNDNTFWTYPISPNNREWAAIAGNWLNIYGNNWNPYGVAPRTGHILWKTQVGLGGLVGGDLGSFSYQPTMSYSYPILAGKVYIPFSSQGVFKCFDLATGELVFTASGSISAAINLPGNTYTQATNTFGETGVELGASFGNTPSPRLFGSTGSTWNYYDPFSGKLLQTITNVTASGYTMTDNCPYVWGYTTAGFNLTSYAYDTFYIWQWDYTKVKNNDWQTGLVWKSNNINNPDKGEFAPGDGSARTNFCVSWDRKYIVIGGGPGTTGAMGFDASNGKSIWNISFGFTAQNSKITLQGTNNFFVYNTDTATIHCYSAATGEQLWKNTFGTYPWNTKASMNTPANDDKHLYLLDPSGGICALSLTDGREVWKSVIEESTEEVTNAKGRWYGLVVAGGIVYSYAGYSPLIYQLNPIPRFSFLEAINATTGETIFKLNGGLYPTAAAYGYLMAVSFFNGYEYCLGKGQTATTVSAPQTSVSLGSSVLIQGTVLDQSPAQPGTPAVADESMSEWMDYLHMQNATLLNSPPTPKGVQVKLTATGPDGKVIDIGTTTTTAKGNFFFDWTPPAEGIYAIQASFDGSDSYWPSSAETAVSVKASSGAVEPPVTPEPSTPVSSSSPVAPTEPVSSPPVSSPTPAVQPGVETSMPLTTYIAVAAVAIVAVVVAVALILRRRAK